MRLVLACQIGQSSAGKSSVGRHCPPRRERKGLCAPAQVNPESERATNGYPLTRQAKVIISQDNSLDHEYLPIAGLPTFTGASAKLIFGADSPAIKEGRVSTYVA